MKFVITEKLTGSQHDRVKIHTLIKYLHQLAITITEQISISSQFETLVIIKPEQNISRSRRVKMVTTIINACM